MKSFPPTLTSFCRQRVCRRAWQGLTQVRFMGRSVEAHADALASPSTVPPRTRTTFADLGLHPPIISALKSAFPNVQYPTEAQAKFIPAILSGKDVLLKDETGSGKSFGLVVALLNKPRLKSKQKNGGKTWEQRHITSLVVVPHRDLAYQLYHWIERMTTTADPAPPMSTIAQVLVRDGNTHLTAGLQIMRDTPPHILIGTPQAIHDVFREDPQALQLSGLSTVVVDEVDYLIETVPKKDPKKSFQKSFEKANRKLVAHPGVTRELLNTIYARRKEMNERRRDEPGVTQHRRRNASAAEDGAAPQLIVSSATLRSHLRNYLFEESGWLNRDHLVKVKGTGKKVEEKAVEVETAHDGLGGTDISHSVLVVSDTGIQNIEGAIPAKVPETANRKADPETLFGPSATLEAPEIDPQMAEKYADKPSPFNPNAFEAIATAFALDVPSVALLVLPSSSPLQRAVYELREMGVNAHGLDLLATDKGRTHLLSGGGAVRENPTLLVSTLATTRGLDLPELTHVFVLGIPEGPKVNGRTVDGYLHIAGRVGRFGRGGKVITVVEKEKEGSAGVSEAAKMGRILQTIDVAAVQFEHFD